MSASLVGSEMCIRDRLTAAIVSDCHASRNASWKRSEISLVTLICPDAVSYTHLTLPTICSV
eukprot:12693070-Alexandrium_andersonii.AAC.1